MKVVLLAGGFGTRIAEESRFRPKPMVEIGGMPILWHIMKSYSCFGHTEFIICAGYRQECIKEWFFHYFLDRNDVTFDYRGGKEEVTVHTDRCEPWKVTVVDTGYGTMTGGRIRRIRPYVEGETFLMTYGDAVCDLDLDRLLAFHRSHGRTATLTTVIRTQDKGILNIGGDNAVKSFREKNLADGSPINAGFMVFEPSIFDYLGGDDCILEKEPMEALANRGELMSYRHEGFWQCMDSVREKEQLEQLFHSGRAPWVKW